MKIQRYSIEVQVRRAEDAEFRWKKMRIRARGHDQAHDHIVKMMTSAGLIVGLVRVEVPLN